MGFISKLFGKSEQPQKKRPKIVKAGEWEAHLNDSGVPVMLYKKGREWLDSSDAWASPSQSFFLHIGYDGNANECIALTRQAEGIRCRQMDEGVESVIVTDAGVAYVLTEEGNLYTLTPEKISQRHLFDERPDAFVLTPVFCVVVSDAEPELVIVKGVSFLTGKTWQRKIRYNWPESGNNVPVSAAQNRDYIVITVPDGSRHFLTTEGSPVNLQNS